MRLYVWHGASIHLKREVMEVIYKPEGNLEHDAGGLETLIKAFSCCLPTPRGGTSS